MYNKFVGFVEDMQKIGARLKSTQTAYNDGMNKLAEGSGNLVKRGEELKKMGALIFGENSERLNNTVFFTFKGIDGSTLLTALDRKGFALASGSACSSNNSEPSHVLIAMGVSEEIAQGAIRISLGINSNKNEVDTFLIALKSELERLKQLTAIAA